MNIAFKPGDKVRIVGTSFDTQTVSSITINEQGVFYRLKAIWGKFKESDLLFMQSGKNYVKPGSTVK